MYLELSVFRLKRNMPRSAIPVGGLKAKMIIARSIFLVYTDTLVEFERRSRRKICL
jgi:hypothetical protein